MTIYDYLNDKDVFQAFYSQLLAKRLITNTYSSKELEIEMLDRLKVHCGFEYLLKCQKMFTDVSCSNELTKTFKKSPPFTYHCKDFSKGCMYLPLDRPPFVKLPRFLHLVSPHTDCTQKVVDPFSTLGLSDCCVFLTLF